MPHEPDHQSARCLAARQISGVLSLQSATPPLPLGALEPPLRGRAGKWESSRRTLGAGALPGWAGGKGGRASRDAVLQGQSADVVGGVSEGWA